MKAHVNLKILSLLLAGWIGCSLMSCGEEDNDTADDGDKLEQEDTNPEDPEDTNNETKQEANASFN